MAMEKGLKSNQWSSETLVRDMAHTAAQPFGRLSMGEMDDDMKAEYLEARLKQN